MKIYGILVLMLLSSCALLKQQEKMKILTDSLHSQQLLTKQTSQQLLELDSEIEVKQEGIYHLSIIADGTYTWHPDSGLKAGKGALSIQYTGQSKQQHQVSKLVKHQLKQEFKEQQEAELTVKRMTLEQQKGLNHLSLIWKLLLGLVLIFGLIFTGSWLKKQLSIIK